MQYWLRNVRVRIKALLGRRRLRFNNSVSLRNGDMDLSYPYSPSIVHQEVIRITEATLGYVSGDVTDWRDVAVTKLKELVGWQEPSVDNPSVESLWEADDELGNYKKINIPNELHTFMPAYICMPHHRFSGRWVICMQGHNSGMHNSLGLDKEHEKYKWEPHGDRDFATWCLQNGYGALCVEQRGLGERIEKRQQHKASHPCHDMAMQALALGRTAIGERLYDVGSAINYLKHNHSNSGSIGVMGHSLGGTMSIYAAALYDEITFCIASGCFSSFDRSILNRYHCADLYVPKIRQYFEFGDVAGMITPKPLLLIQAVNDYLFPLSGVRTEYAKTKTIYMAMGVAHRLRLEITQNGHRFSGQLANVGKDVLGI